MKKKYLEPEDRLRNTEPETAFLAGAMKKGRLQLSSSSFSSYPMFNRAGLSRKFLRFCVFTLTMQRHFADAMGEDATLMKRKRTQKTRRLTDMKFFVFGSVKPRQKIKKTFYSANQTLFSFHPSH